MADIAFFGLGAMGSPIAANLLLAGNRLTVYDPSAAACGPFHAKGARVGATYAATATESDFIVTLLPTSADVAKVMYGPSGVLQAARPDAVLIDMTTGSVADFMSLHGQARARGLTLVDSPIARGPSHAAAKEILFLVGGDDAEIGRVRTVLAPVCEEVVHCGPAGSALKTKIINNYLAGVSVVANAEALALAQATGLERDFLRKLWKRTVAGRGALETVFPEKAFVNDFTPGFAARLAQKDLDLALALGMQHGLSMSTGKAAREMFALQREVGRIDEDWTALLDVLETLSRRGDCSLEARESGPSSSDDG